MCTAIRFTTPNGQLYFGRNLDVATDYHQRVITTPRRYRLPYHFLPPAITQRACIGMGIVAHDLPLYFDCANEAGLAIAGLNFPGYAAFTKQPVSGKINLLPAELMLWITSNFTSVDQIQPALQSVNLVATEVLPGFPTAPLHWLVSDAHRSIVIEQTASGLHGYDNPVGVLTNSPDFPWQLANLNNYVHLTPTDAPATNWAGQPVHQFGVGSGGLGLPGDLSPAARFVRAAYLTSHHPAVTGEAANVAKEFHLLKAVAMTKGSVINASGQDVFTAYTACYSAKSKTYYYNSYDDFTLRQVTLTETTSAAATITQAPA